MFVSLWKSSSAEHCVLIFLSGIWQKYKLSPKWHSGKSYSHVDDGSLYSLEEHPFLLQCDTQRKGNEDAGDCGDNSENIELPIFWICPHLLPGSSAHPIHWERKLEAQGKNNLCSQYGWHNVNFVSLCKYWINKQNCDDIECWCLSSWGIWFLPQWNSEGKKTGVPYFKVCSHLTLSSSTLDSASWTKIVLCNLSQHFKTCFRHGRKEKNCDLTNDTYSNQCSVPE